MRFTRDDIKISFDKPVFYVNEEKKTVVCVLDYKALIPKAGFSPKTVKRKEKNAYDQLFGYTYGEVGFDSFKGSVKTKAKCHADDVFDPEIGCDIAFARAENAVYIEVWNIVHEYADALSEYWFKIDNFEDKVLAHNRHNSDYIEELSEKSLKTKE